MSTTKTMRSAIYNSSYQPSVVVRDVPITTLKSFSYKHYSTSLFRNYAFKLVDLIFLIGGLIMSLLRSIFSFIPPPYGTNKSRKFVLIKVSHGGLNPVDAKFLYGDKLPEFMLPFIKWFVDYRICGIDFSGTVIEAEQNSGFQIGDKVCGTIPPFSGSFTEFVRAPTDQICLIPNKFTLSEASVLPLVGLTCIQSFTDCKVVSGQNVLVIGASGGTGHVAVQISKIKGAYTVAVCSSKNVDFVKSLGADKVIAYDTCDVISELSSLNLVFDFVFDGVSSHDPRDAAFSYEKRVRSANMVGKDGTYVHIGGYFSEWIVAHIKRHFGIDLFEKGTLLFWVRFPNSSDYLKELKKYCDEGKLKVKVSKTFPFTTEGVQNAFDYEMARRTVGKISIQICNDA